MANYKSRSDDQIWWESQPGNRGKTYPGDSIASKQYERNKAAGENNLSFIKSLFKRPAKSDHVDLGDVSGFSKVLPPLDRDRSEYPENPLKEAKGGKISLADCKVNTSQKNSSSSGW
jgi:hypothetical protein